MSADAWKVGDDVAKVPLAIEPACVLLYDDEWDFLEAIIKKAQTDVIFDWAVKGKCDKFEIEHLQALKNKMFDNYGIQGDMTKVESHFDIEVIKQMPQEWMTKVESQLEAMLSSATGMDKWQFFEFFNNSPDNTYLDEASMAIVSS